MNKTLDFRFNGKLNSEISYLFNKISNENRANFNEFVALISRPHTFNLDWWTEGPASRNTYSSPLFHYYCVLNLIILKTVKLALKKTLMLVSKNTLRGIY